MIEALMTLGKLGSVFLLLALIVWYFLKKEKTYIAEIKELNEIVRDNEKMNLEMIGKLASALDRIADGLEDSKSDIQKDINSLKEFINLKLEQLNKK